MKAKLFWHIARLMFLGLCLSMLAMLASIATPRAQAASKTTLADLPQAAQSLVSTTLGREDTRFQFQPTADGYSAVNASKTLRADFSSEGLRLQTNGAQWTFSLHGVGYSETLQTVNPVAPSANANRLEYAHEALTEWFVNGPAGLEQGWTLTSPPTPLLKGEGSILTLALALNGNTRMNGNTLELLRADGKPALNYTGLVAYDATGRELRAWMDMGRDGVTPPLQIHVDDTDAHYPLTIDPYLTPIFLTNSGGAINGRMGVSVAISADGSTIVAGAPEVSASTGAAYVFVKSISWSDTITPTATLTNTNGGSGDALGVSVAISADGSTIVAGAPGVSDGTGAAYVFVKSVSWSDMITPTAMLTNSGSISLDYLGQSVAMSSDGSTIVAGASGVSSWKGAAYVFVKPGGGWANTDTPTATLTKSGATEWDVLGYSVALSANGSTIVAGAYGFSSNTGAAYVFVKPGGGWATTDTPTATLTNSGGATDDTLGWSVALNSDGSTIVAGAKGVSSAKGAAYVFVKPGGGWVDKSTPTATLTNSGGAISDQLGWSVALNSDGSTIVVGAEGVSTKALEQGAAYVFVKSVSWSDTITPTATLTNSGGATNDALGWSVAINSNTTNIVTGAPGVSSSIGAAYVFVKDPTAVTLSSFKASVPPFDLGAWLRNLFRR